MDDDTAAGIDSSETDSATEDVSRRDVLSKSSAGVALGLFQFSGWWGDDDDDGEGTDWGSGGWWGDGDDGDDDDDGDSGEGDVERPIVFVHGGAGSAMEFESQALRFESNGYPSDYLAAFEYNSTAYGGSSLSGALGGGSSDDSDTTQQEVHDALDQKIDDVLAETGADRVYVMGHSLGTSVLGSYLSETDRAAKVAKYVDLDGRAHDSPPGGVETLAVWGMGSTDSSIPDAENVHFDGKSHVQVATDEETFAEVYEFLLGEAPQTTSIEPEPADQITLSGRTQQFPENDVPADLFDGTTLEVYEVDPTTGRPATDEPVATPAIDADGRWGPIEVDGSAHHEFRLAFEAHDQIHHHYRGPELRSNQFVRLHTSRPEEGTDSLLDRGPDHTVLTVLRAMEWWGDQGANNDVLAIDGTNVINETTAPQDQRVISPFVFDAGTDQQTNLDTQPGLFPIIPFLGGVDMYVPAASPPDDTVEITATPRDGAGLERSFAVPNWASSGHRVSVFVPDHTQTR